MNKKISVIILAIIIAISGALMSCGGKTPISDDPATGLPTNLKVATDVKTNAPLMLTVNGTSKYKIVLPKVSQNAEKTAASQLQHYIKESTKADLEIITDDAVKYNKENYYISIGKTKLLEESEIFIDKNVLKSEGVSMNTIGNQIFLTGAESEGTLYAVYEFLASQIGFEVYYTDEIYFNKIKDVPVYQYDNVLSTPDIENRWIGCGMFFDYTESSLMRFQYGYSDGSFASDGNLWGLWSHSISGAMGITPINYPDHPEWFGNGQVCMTEISLMDFITERLKEMIVANPVAKYWQLGGYDTFSSCGCDECVKSNAANGGSAGTYMIFLNTIAENIEKWQIENNIDREILILALAYEGYAIPPATKNEETGKYEPVNDKVIGRSNVGVMYAPITACHSHSYGDEECSNHTTKLTDQLYEWAVCTDNLMLWLYNTDFYNYFLSFNDWGSLKDNAVVFKDLGVKFIFSQSCRNKRTSFDALRLYMRSKLWWDSSLDYNTLFNDFFDNYYKSASSAMHEYFDAIQANYIKIYDKFNTKGCIGYNNLGTEYYSPENWSYEVLTKHKEIINKAYKAVENSNESKSVKEKLRERILVEEVAIDAFLYYNCSTYYSDEAFSALEKKFFADCKMLGISDRSEGIPIK